MTIPPQKDILARMSPDRIQPSGTKNRSGRYLFKSEKDITKKCMFSGDSALQGRFAANIVNIGAKRKKVNVFLIISSKNREIRI